MWRIRVTTVKFFNCAFTNGDLQIVCTYVFHIPGIVDHLLIVLDGGTGALFGTYDFNDAGLYSFFYFIIVSAIQKDNSNKMYIHGEITDPLRFTPTPATSDTCFIL